MRATGILLLVGLAALLVLLIKRERKRQSVTAEFLPPPGTVPAVPGAKAPVQGRIIGPCLGKFGTALCPEGFRAETVDGNCVCIGP